MPKSFDDSKIFGLYITHQHGLADHGVLFPQRRHRPRGQQPAHLQGRDGGALSAGRSRATAEKYGLTREALEERFPKMSFSLLYKIREDTPNFGTLEIGARMTFRSTALSRRSVPTGDARLFHGSVVPSAAAGRKHCLPAADNRRPASMKRPFRRAAAAFHAL